MQKNFGDKRYNFAWSYKSKRKATAWAEVMRKAGIKVRITSSKTASVVWASHDDVEKYYKERGAHSWKILKGRAYAAAERI
jgi:hypothetical protein